MVPDDFTLAENASNRNETGDDRWRPATQLRGFFDSPGLQAWEK
jgi:hypothetical protein